MKYLKTFLTITVAFIILLNNVLAEELDDSTKVYYLKPVLITATRSIISLDKSPTYAELIEKKEIKNLNAKTLSDILQFSDGFFIKDYGTSGGLKTISLRGTSSENNLILVNGVRINNFQNGLVDLSMINPDIVERIEVVQGGNTALYGTDAVGSVVNIFTVDPVDRLNLNFNLSKGSFDYNKIGLSVSGVVQNIGTNFSFIREYGKDNYKYRVINDYNVRERENANFGKNSYYLSSIYSYRDLVIKSYATFTDANRALPGSLSFPSSTASQLDKNIYYQLLMKYQLKENITIELNNGWNYSFQKYKEPVFNINSFSKNNNVYINPQLKFTFTDINSLIFGLEYVEAKLQGTDYASIVKRTQQSLYLTGVYKKEFNEIYLKNIIFYPSVRYEKFVGIGSEASPKIGINSEIVKDFHIKVSFGKNYRVPTLNDLFYVDLWGNKGNPKLKPEYSNVFDAGFNYSFYFMGNVFFDYSYFYIRTDNKIVWKEIEPWVYSPQNIEKVLSKGSLFKMSYEREYYKFSINYIYTDARKISKIGDYDDTYNKQLIYSPKHIWKIMFGMDFKVLTLNINHIIVGKRYINEINTLNLPEYQNTSGNIGLRYNSSFGNYLIKLELNNIFNKSYQVINDYPMPMRNYKISLEMSY